MQKEENILGSEKIGKLIKKFSIPCIISLVVNSLYNMIDQIFIGWGVDYLGNGATNVVFPLVITCLAFALMIGDGTSAYCSLKLGQNKKKDASKGVANGIIASIIISLTILIIAILFLPQLLNIFGCTDNLRQLALSYGYIIVLGIPFMIIGTSLNAVIRADGSPKYSMLSMVLGAILNIILDPIFIFIFKMGVKGAAIATVISQFLTFLLNILYIKKFKTIDIEKGIFIPDIKVIKKIFALGISSFITQMSFVIVFSVENRLLGKYGAISKYGAEIPITVFGIVLKINQILNSIIIGIAVGSQPIIGYNYGAQKYERVKKTLKIVLMLSLITSIIAFILFQTIPDKLIFAFGSGNEDYVEFACLSFRIFLMLCICNGIQIPSGIFFQAIGKSAKSAVLSLSRQIILLLPSLVILGEIYGLMGILYAGPVADGLAFILSLIMLTKEFKNLKIEIQDNKIEQKDIINKNNLNKKIIIAISREYGSGGRYIGKLIGEKLAINVYDKEIIAKTAKQTGLTEEYIKNVEEKTRLIDSFSNEYYYGLKNDIQIFMSESKIIRDIANKESCVIIGRCSNFILKDMENVIKIFIYSNMEDKIKRVTKYYGIKENEAKQEINKQNKLRENYYKHYTENEWDDRKNYDLVINSDSIGVEKVADLVCKIAENILK